MKKIKIYSMAVCPYCVKAKNLLKQRGLTYEEEMIDDWADDQWDELVARTRMKTVPQIFVDDQLIGGFQELADLDAESQLVGWK